MSYLEIVKRTSERIKASYAVPAISLPPANPRAEAEEIARRVMAEGCCLVWAETVQDYLAFVRDDFDRRKVPAGFVVYTDSELRELFGSGKDFNDAYLRLIHEAKKQGGGSVAPDADTM